MKIFCYGDSNTYGWDPRDTWGMPYDTRWPKYLRDKYGYEIVNSGQPGREIPVRDKQFQWLKDDLLKESPIDIIIIMLGTNDVLNMFHPSADAIAERMDKLIRYIGTECNCEEVNTKILLISPLAVKVDNSILDEETAKLPKLLEKVAVDSQIYYLDANDWKLNLACDGIHLTEEAHVIFAEKINNWIESIFRR